MTDIEVELLHIEGQALATERVRLTAAEDLLALIDEEYATYLEGVNRFYAFCDQVKAGQHVAPQVTQ